MWKENYLRYKSGHVNCPNSSMRGRMETLMLQNKEFESHSDQTFFFIKFIFFINFRLFFSLKFIYF